MQPNEKARRRHPSIRLQFRSAIKTRDAKHREETLLKQQFVEGVSVELKRQLLQRPTLSYEETVTAGQQLDLASQISLGQSVNEVSTSGGTNQTGVESPLVDGKCRYSYEEG